MFKTIWKKYLPVIAILLKRSAATDQQLKLDSSDFKKAAGGKKMRYSFEAFRLVNGRAETNAALSVMGREFAEAMRSDASIQLLMKNSEFEFELSGDFELSIRKGSRAAEPTAG